MAAMLLYRNSVYTMMASTVAKLLYEYSITNFCSVVNNFVVSSSLASKFYRCFSGPQSFTIYSDLSEAESPSFTKILPFFV